jgi:class I fructose-bisphosphate aldolase
MALTLNDIEQQLGPHAGLLIHKCETIHKEALHLPTGDVVDTIYAQSNRNNNVLRSIQSNSRPWPSREHRLCLYSARRPGY